MFRNTFQSGFLSILYSLGSTPLEIWQANGKLMLASIHNYFKVDHFFGDQMVHI